MIQVIFLKYSFKKKKKIFNIICIYQSLENDQNVP